MAHTEKIKYTKYSSSKVVKHDRRSGERYDTYQSQEVYHRSNNRDNHNSQNHCRGNQNTYDRYDSHGEKTCHYSPSRHKGSYNDANHYKNSRQNENNPYPYDRLQRSERCNDYSTSNKTNNRTSRKLSEKRKRSPSLELNSDKELNQYNSDKDIGYQKKSFFKKRETSEKEFSIEHVLQGDVKDENLIESGDSKTICAFNSKQKWYDTTDGISKDVDLRLNDNNFKGLKENVDINKIISAKINIIDKSIDKSNVDSEKNNQRELNPLTFHKCSNNFDWGSLNSNIEFPQNFPRFHTDRRWNMMSIKTPHHNFNETKSLNNLGACITSSELNDYILKENYYIQISALADIVTTIPAKKIEQRHEMNPTQDKETEDKIWKLIPLSIPEKKPHLPINIDRYHKFDPRIICI